ncbi:MAG: pyruvate formate lyase family protein [Clostridia bacterium]|nr:pyruvate formate lyase family protein [Clostridia bacterium]
MALTREEILDYAEKVIEPNKCDILQKDCKILEYMFDNCMITVPKENRFFVCVNTAGIQQEIICKRTQKYSSMMSDNGLNPGFEAMAYTGGYDYSHTSAEWDSVIGLGIWGIRQRICKYAEYHKSDEKKQRFYSNILRVYDAALRFMKRASDAALLAEKQEMAAGIKNLCKRAPQNLFEALQTSIIYYVLQHMFDGTYLRTLGRIDSLLYPFYKNENKAERKAMLIDFLKEIDRLKAPSNIPFAIGGTNIAGNSLINKLSYDLVDAYDSAQTNNTKFHMLCSQNAPESIIEKVLNCVRKGNNSIVFMSDEKIIESLVKQGAEYEDAVNYHVVGCYECGANYELTCSCNARVNVPKALEYALNCGKDMIPGELVGLENEGVFNSYKELYAEFERQLVYLCNCAMKATDLCESHYNEIHSAPIMSGTYRSSLEKGGDLYCDYAAKYNNSSVNAIGIGTAVDSLTAIKKAVYEDKILTLDEFIRILQTNWKDSEPLRLLIKNRFPKFGQDNKEVDSTAKIIVKKLAKTISGKANAKGGVYRLGLFSIDWRWEMGEKTAASADGRLCGETLSQNTSASFGTDKYGATAHLKSVASIDASDTPNGAIVDIDMHSSSTVGENGLNAMVASLKTYFELGGFAVHYNVLDTEVLKDAKLNPEKYPNLQVRLCGWNVLFSSLSEKEKDEFIERSMK